MGELKTEKKELAGLICKQLSLCTSYDLQSGAMQVLKESLVKTRIDFLRQLAPILSTISTNMVEKEVEAPLEPTVPALLSAIDIPFPDSTEELEEQMQDIRSMNIHLISAWHKGDLATVKRFSDCISRVLRHVAMHVKAQLWENLR